jgi:hypothetical protein
VPELGEPFDPSDPEGERTFTGRIDPKLLPKPDLSGPVMLENREGVFAHSVRCGSCRLHFVLFSWRSDRHSPITVGCPECGSIGNFLHRVTVLSWSLSFSLDTDREPEIYDVWPFRLRVAGD